MRNCDLIPDDIKQQCATDIASYDTRKTHGVTVRSAENYLKTSEGIKYLTKLNDAFPDLPLGKIRDKAIDQITSGRELPHMVTINEPLVKMVPAGAKVSDTSAFWTTESEVQRIRAEGKGIAQAFGLPGASEAPLYDIYRITPKAPTEVFVSHVAPTSELNGQVAKSGGAVQYIVPN